MGGLFVFWVVGGIYSQRKLGRGWYRIIYGRIRESSIWDVQVHKIGDGLSFKQASILRRRFSVWLIWFAWDGVLGFWGVDFCVLSEETMCEKRK
jgi:hypothetical protein